MKKTMVAVTMILQFFVFFNAAGYAEAKPFVPSDPTMPVSQVKAGMKAEVRTVFSGTQISSFGVTVLGVVPRKTNPKNLILIRVDDSKVRDNGGVAAGMSGSPVYIGKRLIGAFAYSWSFADRSLGLVTPIEDMVKTMNWPDKIPEFNKVIKIPSADAQIREKYKNMPGFNLLDPASGDRNDSKTSPGINISQDVSLLSNAELTPMSIVLQADGLSVSAIKKLEKKFGMDIMPMGASSQTAQTTDLSKRLKPGSAVGVSLIWGDVSMGGIGTLTAVDKDGRFLAFGHPMMEKGAVAFPLTQANIIKVIPSFMHSFKLGYQETMIGLVAQDRPEAIGGYFGKLPPAISYSVRFNDADNNRTTVKRFQTVADPYMAPELGASGLLSVINNEWSRKGEGTMMITYRVFGGGLKRSWENRNIFFSDDNLSEPLEKKFDDLTKVFALNRFNAITPLGIDLDVEVTRSPRLVFIEKLEIENEKEFYSPGDDINLKVTLRPWRSDAVVKNIKLTVPKKAAGICEIDVRAGGIEPNKEEAVIKGLRAITSLESLLNELSVQECNNQVIAEIGGPELPNKKKKDNEKKESKEETEKKTDKATEKKANDETGSEDKKEEENDLPTIFTDTRLLSEVRSEHIKEGSLQIIDTNFYVKGILRKFIKIKNDKVPAGIAFLQELTSDEKKTKRNKKSENKTKELTPEAEYFNNTERVVNF